MEQIKIERNEDKKLTIIKLFGDATSDMIIDALDQFYTSEFTLNVLWDLSDANTSSLTSNQMNTIIEHAKKYSQLRPNGKTAYVSPKDMDFAMARMYQILSELNEHPISHYVFRNHSEAMSWLEE